MLPLKNFDKHGVIRCNLGCPKVCYYQPTKKSAILREKNPQENLIGTYQSQTNVKVDEHVSNEINTVTVTIRITRGFGGLAPQKQKKF